MNRKLIISFVVGLVLGAVAMLIGGPFIGRSLPQAVRGKQETVSGHVTAKRLDQDRLLLTVVTPEGATLATFTRRVNEIELLVEQGDTVTLAMPDYHPFLSDPEITRVMKPGGAPPLVPPVLGDTTAADTATETAPPTRMPPRETDAAAADSLEGARTDTTDAS